MKDKTNCYPAQKQILLLKASICHESIRAPALKFEQLKRIRSKLEGNGNSIALTEK
ncbi:MAG: hypothetical protein NTZ67_09065 [Gammaproteobacteria bacterium]|nr:hypothetical protein [Gammaproteobacteria bacterium]